jgi:hypothetical protein
MTTERRISPNAYQALREALPVVFHYKRPFESFLRSALRDHPELLAGVNFGDLKRHVADQLVQRLVRNEGAYQQTTIELMVAVAGMERFPDLERHEDAEHKLVEARRAVEELQRWTEPYIRDQSEQQEATARREAALQQAAALRKFTDDLRALEEEFLAMHGSSRVNSRLGPTRQEGARS